MADLTTGAAIAGYRIEAVLGHGSMGTVYSAEDVQLERRIALKVLTPELARDERFRERFLRESKLAASLEHPHIVPIHAAGDADGVLYIAMRYVAGRDLGALLGSLGRLDADRTLAILDQVADALDAAHARGLVHRDVKPANILLGTGDYAYLCDFGLAKHASTVSSLTGSRAILGTVDYLAPEQIEAKPVDGRVDVYALGCVLYECLVGEPPHRRDNELAALLAHVNEPPPKPSDRRAELPEALDDVIATALAKDRELRFGTCTELVEAARTALRGGAPALPQAPQAAAPAVRTFLLADVRGYTSYTREHGDEAGAELARRFASLIERLAVDHAGALQELRGDEALVVFDSARQALRFAVALQAKVAEEELPRPIGVGLDAGEAVPVDGGYRGGALNRAARLCALARAGEVLASDAVCELAGATEGVAFGYRRVERLKGFDKPVGVVDVHPAERAPRRELSRRVKRTLAGTRPRLRLLVAAMVAIGASVALPLALLGGGKAAASPFKANTIGFLDAKTLKPAGALDELGAPDGLLSDTAGRLWSVDAAGGSIARIDPRTQQVTTRFPLTPGAGPGIAAGGSLWFGAQDHAAVNRADPGYGNVLRRIELPTHGLQGAVDTTSLAYGAGSIWAAYGNPFRIARIDVHTDRVVTTIGVPDSFGQALLAYGGGSLWVVSQDSGDFWRIDPGVNAIVAHNKLHSGWVEDLRVVGGYAWMPVQYDGGVWKVDPHGNILGLVATGDVPYAAAEDGRYLYLVNAKSGTVSRVDPETNAVRTVLVGHRPQTIAIAGGRIWISLAQSAADLTAGLAGKVVLRSLAQGSTAFDNPDPPLAVGARDFQLQDAVGARLLRYPDVSGPGGTTLVPEIADLPTVSNGGRTYTFRIRPGYRFSPPSNAPVTAEVMRYSIERALSPKIDSGAAYGWMMVTDIAGVYAYRSGKAAHVSGIRVAGNRLSITLVKPAPDFPARISLPFFSAVPLGTPALFHGVQQPIPSAGPYYLAVHVQDVTDVLKRNPNYSGPRPHRLDAMTYEDDVPYEPAALRVEREGADYASAEEPPYPTDLQSTGRLARLYGPGSAAAKKGAQRYFYPPAGFVRYIQFNSTSGPLRNASIRRAINFALDRRTLSAAVDASPSDSILPPGMPGAGGPPVYPLNGPDLTKARRLMRGRHVRLVLFSGTADRCAYCPLVAPIIVNDLAKINIAVDVKTLPDRFGAASDPKAHWDLLLVSWIPDYPDGSDMVNNLFDPGTKLGYGQPTGWDRYNDPSFLARMRATYRVGGAARPSAYRRLVAAMFRQSPPAAVFASQNGPPQFFSPRIGCQLFRPQYGGWLDLAALCIRGKS